MSLGTCLIPNFFWEDIFICKPIFLLRIGLQFLKIVNMYGYPPFFVRQNIKHKKHNFREK